ILRGVRQQQDEPGRFSICSRQAAVVLIPDRADRAQNTALEGFYHASRLAGSAGEFSHFFPASG
ncbi:hypothetical protein, partial [Escherichia coli]|uniref:hypothetical protein n=1 Tax=Escherichia coli TaxID=562 RepID=UPI00237BFE40